MPDHHPEHNYIEAIYSWTFMQNTKPLPFFAKLMHAIVWMFIAIVFLFFAFLISGFLFMPGGPFGPPQVSRVKNDQRNLATGLESYFVDYKSYPASGLVSRNLVPGTNEFSRVILPVLSTPVSYVTNAVIEDPFPKGRNQIIRYLPVTASDPVIGPLIHESQLNDDQKETLFDQGFILLGAGPDRKFRIDEIAASAGRSSVTKSDVKAFLVELIHNPHVYDPSNGTISDGDVLRTRKGIFSPFLLNAESETTPSQTGIPASASLQYDDVQATGSHPAVPGAGPPLP